MISELIRAFVLVFFAEMGDKTQIIAMTFATQYKTIDVLIGVILGIFVNHGIAIVLGRMFSNIIPMEYINLIAGFIFIIFAYLSLIENDEEEEDGKFNKNYGPILTVAITFFLGELGDKSQLTAMTLSAESVYPIVILLGTVSAMTVTSGMGIIVGSYLGDRIPDLAIKILSSVVFYIFGLSKLIGQMGLENKMMIYVLLTIIELILIYRLIKSREKIEFSEMQLVAQSLYEQTKGIKDSLDSICLGEDHCGECAGGKCLVGYTRDILRKARDSNIYELEEINLNENFIEKDLNEDKVLESLALIIKSHREYKWPNDEDFVINKITRYLEEYLFNERIESTMDSDSFIEECKKKDYRLGVKLEKLVKQE